MSQQEEQRSMNTEIIAISSGKGGTGKTLITACLGYALHQSGHRVLMIDTDTGTDGLSLFLLGSEGPKQNDYVEPRNTFSGFLAGYRDGNSLDVEPFQINRTLDHQVDSKYPALISGKGLYGDPKLTRIEEATPGGDREIYGKAIDALLQSFRGQYDYVILDTRGGFSYHSTDVCARADSFIVVTEADVTSFYQDRNLVQRISDEANDIGRKAWLRAIIVNKATQGKEDTFRSIISRDLPIKVEETYPVPLDLEAIKAYKTQQIPFVVAPHAAFNSATLSAFSDILHIVVAQWEDDRIKKWNEMVRRCSAAFKDYAAKRNEEVEQQAMAAKAIEENEALRLQLDEIREDKHRLTRLYDRELDRGNAQQSATKVAPPSPPAESTISASESLEAPPLKPTLASARFLKTRMVYRYFPILGAVLVAAVLANFLLSSGPNIPELQEKLYETNSPPALRRDYLTQIYAAGIRDFNELQFRGLRAPGAILNDISLESAILTNANLAESKFRNATFSAADLTGANFTVADLSGANLREAIMTRAIFSRADLSYADLRGATLDEADLRGAVMYGTDLRGVDLSAALIDPSVRDVAMIDEKTTFPDAQPKMAE